MSNRPKLEKNLTATEMRTLLFDLLERVSRDSTSYFVISHKGKPKAVLMSLAEFESWQETLEIISDPKTIKAIEESEKDLAEGKYSTLDEIFPEFEKRLTIADKSKLKYKVKEIVKEKRKNVSSNRSSKSKKKPKKDS